MPHLRTLKLKLPRAAEYDVYDDDQLIEIITLDNVVGSLTWPKLRDFGLSTLVTTEDDLVDFLLRHQTKLRRLSLSDIVITDGEWTSLFTRIAGKFPRLQKVKLSGEFWQRVPGFRMWSDPGFTVKPKSLLRDAMQVYVRKGGIFPIDDGTLGEDEYEEENTESNRMNYERAEVVHGEEDDGGHDTDGSHIDYGSDEFDLRL